MFRGKKRDGHGAAPKGGLTGHMDDWEALAVDYLDGRLDPESKAAVELHLDGCPECSSRLRGQQGALAFLQAVPLEVAPPELEDSILDEVLFPKTASPVPSRRKSAQPAGWSTLWRRRVKPWVPATVAVAAVFIALVSYGVYQSTGNRAADLAVTTTAVASADYAAETDTSADCGAENLSAGSVGAPGAAAEQGLGASDTTAAVTTTAAPTATDEVTETTTEDGDTTMAAGLMTTVASGLDVTTTETTVAEYGLSTVETTRDRKIMIADLADADAPVCFLFESAASAEEGSTEAMVAAAEQITSLTGLQPLDASISLDSPTFAAYVPRNDATQLVDLLRSIGSSVGLVVGLSTQPPAPATGLVTRLSRMVDSLPELSARRAPQPSVSGWSFTTSTLVPPGETASAGAVKTPADAGTHVLVVIWVRK